MSCPVMLIRADASESIGTGHVMRCLALAQAWQDGAGDVVMVMAQVPEALKKRLLREGISLRMIGEEAGSPEDAEATKTLIGETNCLSVVIDGYQFGSEYQKKVRSACESVLYVDDYAHLQEYAAPFILNQTIGVSADLYAGKADGAKLLLGADYALLRREFRMKNRTKRGYKKKGNKVMITMGGADPFNFSLTALQAIQSLAEDNLEVIMTVGGANPFLSDLREEAATDDRISIRHDVGDMSRLMEWADVVVTAGGSTCWELAMIGAPMIIVVLVDNQRLIGKLLSERKAALLLGQLPEVGKERLAQAIDDLLGDEMRRARLGKTASKIIDGRGAERVVRFLKNAC